METKDGKKIEEVKQSASTHKKTIIVAAFAVTLFLIAGGISAASFMLVESYKEKVYKGVTLNGVDMSGKTRDEVAQFVMANIEPYETEGTSFVVKDGNGNAHRLVINANRAYEFEEGLAAPILSYESIDVINDVYQYGRNKPFVQQVVLLALGQGKDIVFNYELNEQMLTRYLTHTFKDTEQPAQNATIQLVKNGADYTITKIDDQVGYTYNYAQALHDFVMNLDTFTHDDITIDQVIDSPTITRDSLDGLEDLVKGYITDTPLTITLTDDDKALLEKESTNHSEQWTVGPEIYLTWMVPAEGNDGTIHVVFNKERVNEYLKSTIRDELAFEPQNAVFELDGKKVKTFKPSKHGIDINKEKTVENFNTWFGLEDRTKPINLAIDVVEPEVSTEDSNPYGIKEIIGVGRSDFSGSPANRRHNIAVGAASVDGTFLAPGEEFSLLDTLGEIDGANGYLPELVIKGDKTIPEYGGGLCQIGTTTFRGALQAGLEITERRNHSYRVSYYEPAGTDATIYDPAPDFRFKNDTGHHVYIAAHVIGSQLVWEYWGTDDGRQVTVHDPNIFNIVAPPPTKIIYTDELPDGEKKCTESAHSGATATLTRDVIYADGTEDSETWTSVYRPWQAVCLVGGEDPAATAEEDVVPAETDA